jgi:hypothetical protein
VDVLVLETGFVLGDHVDEEIPYSRGMEIIGDLPRAFERRSDVVKAFHRDLLHSGTQSHLIV